MSSRRLILVVLALCGLVTAPARGTILTNNAVYDLNGINATGVENATSGQLLVVAGNEGVRKAMFLFSFASFSGSNIMDQVVESATFSVYPSDNQSQAYGYRLYGFTDSRTNDHARWTESTTQADANWPDRYNGASQYPAGEGVEQLDVQMGVVSNLALNFASNLLDYVRWGVNRDAAYGYSASNGNSQITLLLSRQDWNANGCGFHSRQSAVTTNRPRLVLDVRFPDVGVSIGESNDIANNGRFDFGVFQEPGWTVETNLLVDNVAGESLSSLHVTSMVITGVHASAFALVAPAGTNFYLDQGASNSFTLVFNPSTSLVWGIYDQAWLVVNGNDPSKRTVRVNLRGEVYPNLRLVGSASVTSQSFLVQTWASRTGEQYVIHFSTNLLQDVWTSGTTVRAIDRLCAWTNDDPALPECYYRIERLP